MSLNLISSFGRRGVSYGLYTKPADVTDTEYLSRYFVVSEFSSTFTAGKNAVAVNGSGYLKSNSEILIECIDSTGQSLYIEMAKYSNDVAKTYAYKESTSFIFAIHVYNDIADGVGKLMLYGTLNDGRSVKWMQNITINKTLKNSSRVRFYIPPTLKVDSAEVPILNSITSTGLIDTKTFTGKVQGLAVTPPKDTNLSTVNKRTTDIDYRLTITDPIITNNTNDSNAFNTQLIGSIINLNINRIKLPFSNNELNLNVTTSYIITDVIDNHTLKIESPYYYTDNYNNNTITNIVDANFSISYPFVNYNNTTSSYQTTVVNGITYTTKQSYADIIYTNIRTFSGYVSRHKVYRKSLLSNADYSIVADEPLEINEVLSDDLTQNKYYQFLGKFYNDEHIARYWFTSSNNISLTHSPYKAVNSMFMSSPLPFTLLENDYFMVKNDSVSTNRNATYVPFDMNQYLSESGSAYDSNFMALKANVQYVVEVSAIILKDQFEQTAGLSFYFTSSIPNAKKEPTYDQKFGIKVANITTNQNDSIVNIDNFITFYTPKNDLYGTLVIVPRLCQAYIKNISFRVYGDSGFSPDAYVVRIPWPVEQAGESFDIKSELFDINSNLVYSDLKVLQSFDPSGSTLSTDINSNDQYIYLSSKVAKSVITRKSLTSEYGSYGGRKIYWIGEVKHIETSP